MTAPFQLLSLPTIAASAELLFLPLPSGTVWVTRGFPGASIDHTTDAHDSEAIPGSRFDPAFLAARGGLEGLIADVVRRNPPNSEGVTQVTYDEVTGGDALVSVAQLESLLESTAMLEARGLLRSDPRRPGIRVLQRSAADRIGLRPTKQVQLVCGAVPAELRAAAVAAGSDLAFLTPAFLVRTMFPGELAPRTPEDPQLQGKSPDDPEVKQSHSFWADHVLLDTSLLRH